MRRPLTALAFFPLWWVSSAFLIGQAAFIIGLPLHPAMWALAWCTAAAATQALGAARRDTAFAATAALAAWFALSLLAIPLHDFSRDGQSYHQEAILQLAAGWNPLRTELALTPSLTGDWLNGYPKASWIVQTMTFQIFRHIEAAKSVGWLLGLALSGLAALVCASLPDSRIGRWTLWALFVANPIASCQWCTFLVDGWLAWTLGGAAICALLLVWPVPALWTRRQSAWALVAWLTLLVSLKFTGLIYAVYLISCLVGALLLRRSMPRWNRSLSAFAVSAFCIALVALANPYGTNVLRHSHPFWPLMGPNKRDIISLQEHPVFVAQPGPVKLAWSVAAYSRGFLDFTVPGNAERYPPPRVKPPFALRRSELLAFVAPDVQIGGLGPYFGSVLLAGIALFAFAWRRRGPDAKPWILLWLLTLGSVLINPEAWWLRYVPQAWWLALIPLAAVGGAGQTERRVGGVLMALLCANASAVLLVNTAGQFVSERALRRQMPLLFAHQGQWHPVWQTVRSTRERFREAGIVVPDPSSPPPAAASGSEQVKMIRCDVLIETSDPDLAAALRAALPKRN